MIKFDSIEDAISDIKNGKMVIVVDDESRENEGDFIMAAEKVTPESVNFMATYGRGLICVPISSKRAKELQLDLMIKTNDALHGTAFTVSVDSVDAGTGISAQDRATTIIAMVNPGTHPDELLRPGHIFPLIAQDGGVLIRNGHTEAATDLASLAGLKSAGVICEVQNTDGSMARVPELLKIAKDHDLKLITIKDLVDYRIKNETFVTETSCIDFPNEYGDFKMHMFENSLDPKEHHMAFIKGDVNNDVNEEPVLVRVHSECFTGDLFGSKRCDCGEQLKTSMNMIEEAGRGVLIYLKQEGRGIGLKNKIKAYDLQDQGYDTISANHKLGFETDLREYGFAAQILKLVNIKKIKLLTNNPSKLLGLLKYGIEISERLSLEVEPNEVNLHYLKTKQDKMGHLFSTKQH
ncbi:MAG: bifunctional 3,4-dihydroxy-2-butanone-4-phosphate synthase/GTP cyclohydrolase II [Epsilonproteobacteria bacterium]|nr:MAG: bifunctional 3,4-dihydroxy-2-butanone-4-phosphate synthase/GTP cyclohydrolase II [Campylobacterota bacterium]RLA65722.1 MAG: bifunctional 3,4-dihydroxy-2-butanone-4-phosphate synthase/GTP cyclohydrolase II [Campylobacterota bacterium]